MGNLLSKRRNKPVSKPEPTEPARPEDKGLRRIKKVLNEDLETFVLNNVLLCVQFFEDFEREVKPLRKVTPSEADAEHNKALTEHQRRCISPDRLNELVRRRVLFRPEHGEGRQSYELLYSPRMMLPQDNVEVVEAREDDAVYSIVKGTPSYRFIVQPTTNRPGYVHLRAEEWMLPQKRRGTYETIKDEEELVSGDHIPTHSPNESDSARSTIEEQVVQTDQTSPPPETQDLTENGYAGKGPPFRGAQSKGTDPTPKEKTTGTKRVFGPQRPDCDPIKNSQPITETERRLSGIGRHFRYPDTRLFQKNGSSLRPAQSEPNLATHQSPKGSGSSGNRSGATSPESHYASGSEYGYTTITEAKTPRPLKTYSGGQTPQNTSEIPDHCFREKEVKYFADEEYTSNSKRKKKFVVSHYYLDSISYMQNFEHIFAHKIGASLGFTRALASATTQGPKIHCAIIQTSHDSKPIKIRQEIIPTLTATNWPEQAHGWKTRKRKVIQTSTPGVHYSWPTEYMMEEMKDYVCHLLPLGYMPTRGKNEEQFMEWQLVFPEAERFLEACLTHAQVRCFLFSLALYKTFLEPLNTQIGLHPTHIRTLLFWQCERGHVNWSDDRLGDTLCKFLDALYEAIKHMHLEDYFIEKRNLFESTPRTHLLKVQEKLLRIRENLLMHVLLALRNLRYNDSAFYPVLDYKKLYDIITHNNQTPNPLPQRPIAPNNTRSQQQQSDDDESEEDDQSGSNTDLWKGIKNPDREKKWKQEVRQQIELERATQRLFASRARDAAPKQRKMSTDSIDIKLQPKKYVDTPKKMELLRFFIPHFIEMARKSNHFKATKQAKFYLKHVERLHTLLREYGDGRPDYSTEIMELYEEMGVESTNRVFIPTEKKQPPLTTEKKQPPLTTEKKQPPLTVTPKKPERSVKFREPPLSTDDLNSKVQALQDKTKRSRNLPSYMSGTETVDEQSQPNTTMVTHAQVHSPNTNTNTHTPPSTSTSPESTADMTHNPHPSSIIIADDIMRDSTDT